MTKEEARYLIEIHEYRENALNLLNHSGVDVRNLKRIKGGWTADVVFYFEDIQERVNNCIYPDNLLNPAPECGVGCQCEEGVACGG